MHRPATNAAQGGGPAAPPIAGRRPRWTAEKELSARAASQVDILNQQIAALRRQLAALEDALSASRDQGQGGAVAKIADLGSRLNVALAQRVQELAKLPVGFLRPSSTDPRRSARRPRSSAIGSSSSPKSCSTPASPRSIQPGDAELDQLATALIQLEREIPSRPQLGDARRWPHRCTKPVHTGALQVELGALGRRGPSPSSSISSGGASIPHQARRRGVRRVPADRSPVRADEALRKNRRIELKLTER